MFSTSSATNSDTGAAEDPAADLAVDVAYRPRAVVHVARMMVAIAVVNLVALLLLFIKLDDVRRLLRDATPPPSPASVDTALWITAIGYVAFVVLFPLLTRHVTQGRGWARTATWVLAGVGIVTTLQRLGRHQPSPSRALDLAGFVLDLAIVVLLAARPTNRWFRPR